MTISVGQKAPDFTATAVYDEEFHKITLSDYINKYYVVLFFYPLDFTFVCPTEITGFSDKNEEFEKLSTKLFGISVDSEFSHLVWTQSPRKSGGLGFIQYPLISDLKKQISSDYGVLTEEGVPQKAKERNTSSALGGLKAEFIFNSNPCERWVILGSQPPQPGLGGKGGGN